MVPFAIMIFNGNNGVCNLNWNLKLCFVSSLNTILHHKQFYINHIQVSFLNVITNCFFFLHTLSWIIQRNTSSKLIVTNPQRSIHTILKKLITMYTCHAHKLPDPRLRTKVRFITSYYVFWEHPFFVCVIFVHWNSKRTLWYISGLLFI